MGKRKEERKRGTEMKKVQRTGFRVCGVNASVFGYLWLSKWHGRNSRFPSLGVSIGIVMSKMYMH